MLMRQITFLAILLATLLAGAVPRAFAHHSYAAFDTTVQKTINGTIRKFDWTNPHTWVWVDVTNEQGGVDTWGVEGMSPNFLARRGWTRTTLKPGDPISITIRPAKDGSKGGLWMSAKRPSGETLMMGGPITNP